MHCSWTAAPTVDISSVMINTVEARLSLQIRTATCRPRCKHMSANMRPNVPSHQEKCQKLKRMHRTVLAFERTFKTEIDEGEKGQERRQKIKQ